jgi:hypothetical protein
MQVFNDDTTWFDARGDVRDTIAALRAAGSHGKLLGPLTGVMATWATIDTARQVADDELRDANVLIVWLDGSLDEAVGRLASRLLNACDNDRTHPTFVAYFPEAPHEVMRLGLMSEVERVNKWRHVRKEIDVAPEVAEALDEVAVLEDQGREALQKQRESLAMRARVALRIKAWREEANQVRRTTETALDAYANTHRMPRSYSARFFTKAPTRAKKKTADTKPADAPR